MGLGVEVREYSGSGGSEFRGGKGLGLRVTTLNPTP